MSVAPLASLQPVSIVDQVTSAVRRSILAGELKPGSDFSITDLAASLNVSPIPVREALQRLEAQGLILRRRARTAIVAPITTGELREIYELRIDLECQTAARAASLMTEQILKDLKACLATLPEFSLDSDEFWLRHYRFHRLLLSPALNPMRERILGLLWNSSERYVRLLYGELGSQLQSEEPYNSHLLLLTAAEERSGHMLQKRLAEHYESHLKWMLKGLAASAPAF